MEKKEPGNSGKLRTDKISGKATRGTTEPKRKANSGRIYWTTVLNSLRNRGVEDILIACTDHLTGFSDTIAAV